MIAQDIVAQKVTKLESPTSLETMVVWGQPNEELKLLQIQISLQGLPVGNLLVEARNSILSVTGMQMINGSNKNVFETRFELADDVDVLSAHKDGNWLLLNLKYDCPKLMQDRTIEIVEL